MSQYAIDLFELIYEHEANYKPSTHEDRKAYRITHIRSFIDKRHECFAEKLFTKLSKSSIVKPMNYTLQ